MIALVLDTETSGLIDNRSMPADRMPEVIEFYGVLVDLERDGKVLREMSHLIRPVRPIQETATVSTSGRRRKGITEITGITNQMLEGRPLFVQVAEEVINFIELAPLVIAQNASFDVEMLDIEAERAGMSISWPPVICTIEQSIHYKGFRLNLADLHEHLLGVRFEGAHRAKADVEALVRCCVEMRRRGDL